MPLAHSPTARDALRAGLLALATLTGVSAFAQTPASAEPPLDLRAYTEDWAPYSLLHKGEVRGIATDILRQSCEEASLRCSVEIQPWARAYQTVLNHPNTVLFSTVRRPDREADFLWVGPLLPRTVYAFVRADKAADIRQRADLVKLKFGLVRGGATHKDLEAAGVPPSQLITDSSNMNTLRLFSGGWVDALVDTEIGMAWIMKSGDLKPGTVSKTVKVSDDGAYYFALNLQTSPDIVKRLQLGLDRVRKSGQLERIIRQYTGAHGPDQADTRAAPR